MMKQKLMSVMAERDEGKPRTEGRVEVDDAYLGGERTGGKRGRGTAGKTPFIAAVETTAEHKPGRNELTPVKGLRKKEVEKLARLSFATGTNIVSDGLSCWRAVEAAGCDHFPMRTGHGKQATRWTPFQWVNTTLGNIKTSLAGTDHHVSAKHARSYPASFAWRFNRRYPLDALTERLMWAGLMAKSRPYRVIVAG